MKKINQITPISKMKTTKSSFTQTSINTDKYLCVMARFQWLSESDS